MYMSMPNVGTLIRMLKRDYNFLTYVDNWFYAQ